jgi:hypothetical protein
MSYSPVSIDEVKAIAEAHGLHEIIVWSFNEEFGQHVTTYGFPATHSIAAARGGDELKQLAGWPNQECGCIPRINPQTVRLAAAAIANARAGRRGAPPISNVLDILPDKLLREVSEDAEAVLAAIGFEKGEAR